MEIEKIKKILDQEPEEAVAELLEDVEERYGEIPYIINFMKDMPSLFISRMIYENSVMRQMDFIDPKTVELISIAVASALRCEYCLRTHVRVAKRLGISKEEMFSATLIAATISSAAVLAEGTRSLDSQLNSIKTETAGREGNCSVCSIVSQLPEED
ncbi:MAG: carboxymuconolactone decarboxylase family protein [Methanolobus sp.]|jgi:AhpD family alkylhydroperoxidase|uniref:carboxymuconolactone decarboxylase family protein n=1 Tax=Methanolobus sp. TaxID=1874737 RepID=UPI00272F33B3|nr:carboxymuconolactone decarboxylase family protein [Methanolobus sp.]MDP2216267.1 carboxymuconolactone decarboxylase family protein [Methanolobus sp.]